MSETPQNPEHQPQSLPTSRQSGKCLFIGAASIAFIVLVVYWPALRGGFIWDDLLLILQNPLMKGEANLASIWFREDFPLSMTVLWLQSLVWGQNAIGFHAVNVLLHGVSCVILWRTLERLKTPGAFLGALIFAVHPVAVGSVAWISELKNTLSLLFFLLSIWCFLKFDEPDHPKQHHLSRLYWFSLGTFLLALLSKTSTVMLPFMLAGCIWWRRGQINRKDLWRLSPYFLCSVIFGSMTVWFQTHQASATEIVPPESLATRIAAAGMAIWFYLGKSLLPLNLSAIYPRWQVAAASFTAYAPLILVCISIAVLWAFRRTWGRSGIFVFGVFILNLLPVLGLIPMSYQAISRVSDHLVYLSLIPVAAAIGAALQMLFQQKKIFWPAACVLVGTLSVLSFQRAEVFSSDEKLWTDTLKKNPTSWTAHNNLGCIRAEQNQIPAAISHFEESLKFNPKNSQAHVNLARALGMQNQMPRAREHLEAALKIRPDDADANALYGAMLAGSGKPLNAIPYLQKAVRVRPSVDGHLQLASLFQSTGNTAGAIEQCRAALKRKPDAPQALNNLAWLLATASDAKLRDGAEAVQLAEKACQLTGYKEAAMVGTLAAAYAEAGRFNEATQTAQKAVNLATAAGNLQFARMNQQLQTLYQSGKAYHEPARSKPVAP